MMAEEQQLYRCSGKSIFLAIVFCFLFNVSVHSISEMDVNFRIVTINDRTNEFALYHHPHHRRRRRRRQYTNKNVQHPGKTSNV